MIQVIYKLCLLISLFSCLKNKSSNFTDQINFPLSSDISSLDPAIAFDEVSLTILYQVYEPLFEYDYNTLDPKLVPLLAKKMPTVSEDLLTYTFHIKENITYHSHPDLDKTRKVKAQDFVTQIKRLAYTPLKGQGFWLFEGKIEGIDKFKKETKTVDQLLNNSISGIKVLDDHTFSIKLLKPYPQMLYAMAMAFTVPIPAELLKKNSNLLENFEVGTGPFTLDTFKRSHKIILKKYDKYHNTSLPKVSTIHFPFMKESQTRWLNFLNNKIDFFGIGKSHYNLILNKDGNLKEDLAKKDFKLIRVPSLTYWWFSFNMGDSIFSKNKNLRLAFSHAINREKYVELFTNNTAKVANSIYHPTNFGYSPENFNKFNFNTEKAKNLLAQAGYPNGKGLPEITLDTRSSASEALHQAEFIKSQLQKIGVNLKIETNTFEGFLRKARKGKLEFWLDGWHLDYPDSENILQLLSSKNHPPGVNSTYYKNSKFDQLFEELKITPNNDRKIQLMRELEEIVQNDLPWSMLFYSRSYSIYHKRIKNYKSHPMATNKLKYLSL